MDLARKIMLIFLFSALLTPLWYVAGEISPLNSTLINTTLSIITKFQDTTPPSITFVSPTPDNNSVLNRNYVYINVTSNEPLTQAKLEWNGSNYSMSGSGTNWYYNFTGLSDGIYEFRVYGRDAAGNQNSTETRYVIIDTTAPIITIHSPQNTTYNTSSVDLNVSANEPISAWWYSLDGNNTNFTPNITLTNLSNGVHSLTICAIDLAGNVGKAQVEFTIAVPQSEEINKTKITRSTK